MTLRSDAGCAVESVIRFSTLPIARITLTLVAQRPDRWGWQLTFTEKEFASRRFVWCEMAFSIADTMRLLLANVRGNVERRGDFDAQIGSLKTGAARLLEIIERRGESEATEYASQLINYSARLMRYTIASIPDGSYEAEDALDDDGVEDRPVTIKVRITIKGERAFG